MPIVLAHGSAGTEPAGGAAMSEALAATGGALAVTALLVGLLALHRGGRIQAIERIGAAAARATGLPGWSALPSLVVALSLLTAVFGMYWDISLHIDDGRDPGPLANPAHWFILVGLFGVLFAGMLAVAMPREGRPSLASVRIRDGWYAPLGGVLIAACGGFALSGFPLDDLWHRLFGQDVTLWGPTHLLLIGGGGLATVGAWLLFQEGADARRRRGGLVKLAAFRQATLVGGLLAALSTFQAEFDFGVPQFRLLFHPILLAAAAGIALVAARTRLGRGGALMAVLSFLVIRGLLAVLVGPVLGQTTPHFPLYIAEALVVEGAALVVSRQRPLLFGAVAGAGIGTVGLAAEWGWSHVWMPIPWSSALLPEAALIALPVAVAAGMTGAAMGAALSRDGLPDGTRVRWAVSVSALVIAGAIAYALPVSAGDPVTARVSLDDARPAPEREAVMTVRLDRPDAARDAEWFHVMAWQGGQSRLIELAEIAPGTYRAKQPVPVHGGWKSVLRLHRGDAIQGMPVFLPRDEAIPAAEVPAASSFEREFVLDKANLQREAKEGVAAWQTTAAYLTVLAIALGLIGSLAWGIGRLARFRARERTRAAASA